MDDILIDVSRLADRLLKGRLPTGVDRVSLAYVAHYAPRARAVVRVAWRTIVLSRGASEQLFSLLLHPSKDFGWMVHWLVGRESLRIPDRSQIRGAFLFNTSHSGLEQKQYPLQLRRQGVKPLFFVHDLIPITHPEYCRAGEREAHAARIKNVLETACGIVVNSNATLTELSRYAGVVGKTVPPCVVAPLAPSALPVPLGGRPVRFPYFVMLGTIEPRKNHWLMLQLWRRLVEQFGAEAPKLVIIGQRGWEHENVDDLLERCDALRGHVLVQHSCTDAELSTYLHHAQALLFPSFAEGYGMPLAEALSCGVPVLASSLPVFREIADGIPEYADPLDTLRWMKLIIDYASPDSTLRAGQLERMRKFRRTTWSRHLQRVDEFLEQLRREEKRDCTAQAEAPVGNGIAPAECK